MRKLFEVVIVCSLLCSVAFASDKAKNVKSAPLIIDDGIERATVQHGAYIEGLDQAMSLNWFPVDSMPNAFGPASTRVRPISFDPATNTVALIHRGVAPYGSSGQLWYNISRDAGLTWRRVGELNGGTAASCRYPAGAISNPANSSDTSQCLYVYVAPNLESAGTWGFYTYGADQLGFGAGFGVIDNVNYMGDNSAAATIWGTQNSNWVVWCSTMGDLAAGPNNSRVWRTQDYTTVSSQIPTNWTDAEPNFINAISFIPGMSNSTGSYFGMHGLFFPDSLAANVAFNGGYAKSTDNGATWANWVRPQPDWMTATGLAPRYDLYDYVQPPGATVSWNGDMIVDGNGRVHFFHVIADSPWTTNDPRHILEVYETAPNSWAYKWVKQNLNTYTALGYPSSTGTTTYLQQTNQAIHSAVSSDGQVLAMVWLDAATMSPADSLPDIWFSTRRINSPVWTTPANLTQTPGYAEFLLHAAPTMKSNGGNSYTLFLGHCYQSGVNTFPPDNNVKTTFFVAAHTFTTTSVGEGEERPSTFRLEQNYPNPFNPTTKISYTIPARTEVRLSVYDVLGQEVASLVNEVKDAGSYDVDFSAANLTSGVYFYTLRAGQFVETKKLVLVK